MAKNYIPINPRDKVFAKLLADVRIGLTENKPELVEKAKATFAEAGISLFFNEERGLVRVLQAGRPPIDFAVGKPKAPAKEVEKSEA